MQRKNSLLIGFLCLCFALTACSVPEQSIDLPTTPPQTEEITPPDIAPESPETPEPSPEIPTPTPTPDVDGGTGGNGFQHILAVQILRTHNKPESVVAHGVSPFYSTSMAACSTASSFLYSSMYAVKPATSAASGARVTPETPAKTRSFRYSSSVSPSVLLYR